MYCAVVPNELRWRCRRRVRHAEVPPVMRSWLYDDDSLTARLRAGCGRGFRVEVLRQRYIRPQYNEAQALGIDYRQYALLREVYLYCGQSIVVYARSIIPLSTLTGPQRRLASLGPRPLGGFLFASPSLKRGEVELARLAPGNAVYERAMDRLQLPPQPLWGRRSVFRLQDKPLLVAEIFLPAIETLPTASC